MIKDKKCNCQFEEGHSPECPMYVENKFYEPQAEWEEQPEVEIWKGQGRTREQ